MTDIVLVHPSGSNWLPELEKTINSVNRMPPLGMMYISSYLKRLGYSVELIDCNAELLPSQAWIKRILDLHPSCVGFSCTTSSFLDGYAMAEAIKQEEPDTEIIFGGVHVSSPSLF